VISCRALLATAVATESVVTSASEATASGRDMTSLNIELLNSEDRKPPFWVSMVEKRWRWAERTGGRGEKRGGGGGKCGGRGALE